MISNAEHCTDLEWTIISLIKHFPYNHATITIVFSCNLFIISTIYIVYSHTNPKMKEVCQMLKSITLKNWVLIIVSVSLIGCSGVSQEQFDAVSKDLTATQNQLSEKEKQFDVVSKDLTATQNQLSETKNTLKNTDDRLVEADNRIIEIENRLNLSENRIEEIEPELSNAKKLLEDSEYELGKTKNNLTDTQNTLLDVQSVLKTTNEKLSTTEDSLKEYEKKQILEQDAMLILHMINDFMQFGEKAKSGEFDQLTSGQQLETVNKLLIRFKSGMNSSDPYISSRMKQLHDSLTGDLDLTGDEASKIIFFELLPKALEIMR